MYISSFLALPQSPQTDIYFNFLLHGADEAAGRITVIKVRVKSSHCAVVVLFPSFPFLPLIYACPISAFFLHDAEMKLCFSTDNLPSNQRPFFII